MNKKNLLGLVFTLQLITPLFAQKEEEKVNELEEVVVSDSKFQLSRSNSGKVITKISSETLEKSQGKSVAEVINMVSGIHINGATNYAGQDLGVYVRGGRNRQVLVRIDGVTVTDPSSTSNSYDFRLLPIDQIKEIEILKGAASTLYGSGAATAVINITTKEAADKKITAHFTSSLGTQQSQEEQDYDITDFNNSVNFSGTLGKIFYRTGFSQQSTSGLSSNEAEEGETAFRDDQFSSINTHAKIGYRHNEKFQFHFYGNFDEIESEFDSSVVDADNRFESSQTRIGSHWEYNYGKGSIVWSDGFSKLEREIFSDFPTLYESRFYTFDGYHTYEFGDSFKTVIGANGLYSDFNFSNIPFGSTTRVKSINDKDADFDIIDPYVNGVYITAFGLQMNAGARLNIHSKYGNQFVYNINPSYTHTFGASYLKALASYSTAYITPTLFQLFDTAFGSGNPDLKPEESITVEAGLEYALDNRGLLSLVYFNRASENFIGSDATFRNINIEEPFEVQGIEAEAKINFLDKKLSLTANYTYTDTNDLNENQSIRIPKHKINTTLGYDLNAKTSTSLSFQYTDTRSDTFFDPNTFSATPVSLNAYHLLDFYISHQVLDNFKVFATVTNITNDDYQEIIRFSTRGRNVKIGMVLSF